MKDRFVEPSLTRQIQPQESETTTLTSGCSEPRQNEKVSLASILTGLRKYWYVSMLIGSLMMTGVIYKTAKEPRIYKSGIQIAIELKSPTTLAEKLSTSAGNHSSPSDERDTTLETITQKLKSKTFLKKAVESIPNPRLRPSVDTVLQNLTIHSGQNTNILNITYTDTIPERIVATLNALSKVYVDYSIKNKKAHTDSSIAFIESQLPESRQRLTIASKQLEKFRRQYRFVDPASSAAGLAEYRQEIIKKLNENRVEYDRLQKQYIRLKGQLAKVGLESNNTLTKTMLTQDSAYQDLFKKLSELELNYSQEKVRLTDDNPIAIRAKEKRDDVLLLLKKRSQEVLKRSVPTTELTNGEISNFGNNLAQNLATKQTELETNLAAQTAEYQSLAKVSQQIELQIDRLPTLQQQYTELQRQYNIYSQELTAFLQKLQELKIADAEQIVPWTVLDPPELPQSPIFPNVAQQLGLGTVGSLFVGLLAAFGLSKLDRRIDNPHTIKSMTGMPILATIPKVDGFNRSVIRVGNFFPTTNKSKNYKYWSFIEAIRILALGIGITTNRAGMPRNKAIAITSSVPKEGKSIIAFHTSIVLAELGYRVLLVDVDLHKSTIADLCRSSALFRSIDCADEAGLSDVLLQRNNWQDLIKKTPRLNLEILFSGSHSLNSISLLNSPNFKGLIELWKQEYDYVLFDTPPIVGVSDTHLIATLVDGLVYIVSLNVAQQSTIDDAIDILLSLPTPVLGLVINQTEHQRSSQSQYSKYYQKTNSLSSLPEIEIASQLANYTEIR